MEAAALPPNGSQSVATQGVSLERPARALIGWMPTEEAVLAQAGRRTDVEGSPAFVERARRAREAVFARQPGVDQEGLLQDVPSELGDHVNALRNHDAVRPMFDGGWEVKLVDLARVCAFQGSIFTDRAVERVAYVDAADLRSVAAVAIPIPEPAKMPIQFDQTRQAWILSAPNPNLRIVGNFTGNVEGGGVALGFAVRVMPSFIQVASFEGRQLLRDGYHRAHGFLTRGISTVPAFVRDFDSIEDLVPAGMLPQAAYLGPRPPTLPDYLDDDVSAPVQLPTSQKMIVIQGLEISPLG